VARFGSSKERLKLEKWCFLAPFFFPLKEEPPARLVGKKALAMHRKNILLRLK